MSRLKRVSNHDRWFDILNQSLLGLCVIIVLYPLYFVVISSISDPNAVNNGQVILWPVHISMNGYRKLLADQTVWLGYLNTIIYTVCGTTLSVAMTMTSAFALSRKELVGRYPIMLLILFTMLFSGGLIPSYLVVKKLGLLDTIGAMILPHAVLVWNLIVARTFLQQSIPDELFEAARMDGCSHFRYFWRIVLPLSPTLIAIMSLFYAVFNWNSFFDALIYLSSPKLYPLQLVLRNILISSQALASGANDPSTVEAQMKEAEQIKYGLIIVASAPLLMIYPFLQKYFIKGVMIGSIKG